MLYLQFSMGLTSSITVGRVALNQTTNQQLAIILRKRFFKTQIDLIKLQPLNVPSPSYHGLSGSTSSLC